MNIILTRIIIRRIIFMQDMIPAYVNALTQQEKSGYEKAARVCSAYFDERGIDTPTAEDWKEFEADYPTQYERETGKTLSSTTLKQNYVARGKAFYRWCANQDDTPTRAPAVKTEASPHDDEPRPVKEEKQSAPQKSEGDKPTTRISLLLDKEIYTVLAVLSALEDKTMTAILTEGARLYIREHQREAAIARGAIDKVRGQ